MAHLEGYVSHIRFHNEENGYTVMEIETTHGDEVLVGNFHYINEGEYICAEGEYVDRSGPWSAVSDDILYCKGAGR